MVDVRNFQSPKNKGASPNTGMDTPQTEPEKASDEYHQEPHSTADINQPEETNQSLIQEYLHYLEQNDIHKEDIMAVLDSIITSGNVYWSFELFDKIPVTFKIRPAWVNDVLVSKMDKNPPRTFNRFSETVGLYNLAGSLVEYNGERREVQNEEDFYNNKQFVQNLPFIIQSHLIQKMSIFDRVISVATSDWATENFTKPQSEE